MVTEASMSSLATSSVYYRAEPVRKIDLNQTLYTTVFKQNKNNMDLKAVSFLNTELTYKKLLRNTDYLANAYSKMGVKEGDTVAICTINMPIVQENLLALSKLGATSKWIDLRIKPKELIHNLNESNCTILVAFDGILPMIKEIIDETNIKLVVVASPKDYLNPLVRFLANIKDKKEGKFIDFPKDKRFMRYKKLLNLGKSGNCVKPVPFKKDRPSIIVQSSGSTGKAKSIVHTEYNFNSSMLKEAYTDLPLYLGQSMHIAIPPFIIYGLNNSIYASLVFGMNAQLTPFVSDTTVYDDLGKYEIACATPVHYRYLYNKIVSLQQEIQNSDTSVRKAKSELDGIFKKLSKIKVFVSGGDKISASELLNMERLFKIPIVNGYGNNEMVGAAIISPLYASKPNSVGIPLKGINVKIFDPETNAEVTNGNEGEICFNSDNFFISYFNNAEETSKIKQVHSDGLEWIHSGDLGYVDSDGYVYISGRNKRLIKRKAFKIAPETIESVIMNVAGIKDCVVVGVSEAGDENSKVPMAWVELSSACDEPFETIKQKIQNICENELPEYEQPEYIVSIEKMPYKNNKHNFQQLEEMGETYVRSFKANSKN